MRIYLMFIFLLIHIFSADCLLADEYCDKIKNIKTLPFKNEKVVDEVYNGLLKKGGNAIPCLIEKLTDTTIMEDPRKAPPYEHITVGDVAFFVLLDITGLSVEELLPDSVKDKYRKEGIYAYFKFVNNFENRKKMQKNWQNWLKSSKRLIYAPSAPPVIELNTSNGVR